MMKAVLMALVLILLSGCEVPEKTNFNYCSEDSGCKHYWMGYDSKMCPVCDVTDERWVCANAHEGTVRIAELLEKEAFPQNCAECKLQIKGHACKCVRGVCVKD